MSKMMVGLALGGEVKQTRPLNEIMTQDSRIGVAEIDRYTSEFDPDANDGKGAFVRVSNVTPEVAVDLVCNEGKGTGSQTISEVDLPDAVEALQEIIAADFERPEGDDESWQPPSVVIRNSWRMVHPKVYVIDPKTGKRVSTRDESKPRDYVAFRTRNGKGSKPVEVHRDELPQVIALLSSLPDQIEAHRDSLWDDYQTVKEAQRQAEEAERQAKEKEGGE